MSSWDIYRAASVEYDIRAIHGFIAYVLGGEEDVVIGVLCSEGSNRYDHDAVRACITVVARSSNNHKE